MILEKAFFWTMPQNDLKIAEEYWQDIRKHVLRNEIGLDYFWKLVGVIKMVSTFMSVQRVQKTVILEPQIILMEEKRINTVIGLTKNTLQTLLKTINKHVYKE